MRTKTRVIQREALKLKTNLQFITSPPERTLAEQFAFGHREVLVQALGLSPHAMFKGTVQHGWINNTLKENRPRARDNRGRLYTDFVWSDRAKSRMISVGQRRVQILGSPWAHLALVIEKNRSSSEARTEVASGTVTYFPSHSHHGWEAQISSSLSNLAFDVTRLRICLYWLDYLNQGIHDLLKRQKLEVICAGYRGSSGGEIPWANVGSRVSFLVNLYKIIYESDVIICDDVSTTFWYALSLGKQVILLHRKSSFNTWNTSDLRNQAIYIQDNEQILKDFDISYDFAGYPLNRYRELTNLARAELGWDYAQEPLNFKNQNASLIYTDLRIPAVYLEDYEKALQQLLIRLNMK